MLTLANSKDPYEVPHNTAFHRDLHCLLRGKQSLEKEIQFYLEIITCDPSINTMEHSKIIISKQKEESILA